MRNFLLAVTISFLGSTMYFYKYSFSNYTYAEEPQKSPVLTPEGYDPNESKAKQIENTNIYYKDRVFGNTFRGLAMSIAPEQDRYEIGDEIRISTLFKNFSEEEILLYLFSDNNQSDFMYALYFPDGSPAAKSEYAKRFETNSDDKLLPRRFSERDFSFKPREIHSFSIPVGRFFKIEKEGTYFLVMMRRITDSWEDGFMISNMTKINIVKKKTEKQE
ncbi:MAG: hypothetical protein JW787_08160 [Sedimentisphaerales bacterium]|nr:hypothetical protein [Sedimentisphaerales bacterium]